MNISPHDPAKDIYEAKERIVALFEDLETYMEFMTKQQEKHIKLGTRKYVRLPRVQPNKPVEKPDA